MELKVDALRRSNLETLFLESKSLSCKVWHDEGKPFLKRLRLNGLALVRGGGWNKNVCRFLRHRGAHDRESSCALQHQSGRLPRSIILRFLL